MYGPHCKLFVILSMSAPANVVLWVVASNFIVVLKLELLEQRCNYCYLSSPALSLSLSLSYNICNRSGKPMSSLSPHTLCIPFNAPCITTDGRQATSRETQNAREGEVND